MREQIFISSVQKELAVERRAVAEFVRADALLRQFFTVFLFEELPAVDRRVDDIYLSEVVRSAIYVGLLGNEYGSADGTGVSPTEHEFDRAAASGDRTKLIFVKGGNDTGRHPKMQAFIKKACEGLVRRRFNDPDDLTRALYASLVEYLSSTGRIHTGRFDETVCHGATIADIDADKIRWFLSTASAERQYPLPVTTPPADALTHLDLLADGQPTIAGVLLFGREPQRFLLTSEVKCLHFHGTEVQKPIPAYQVYKGTVFDLVDQAVNFVMSRISREVGSRALRAQATVEYELPRDAVAEAIVNAVVHRDYTSNGSVQVMLFADRLDVRNPGELPATLTLEKLRRPHTSVPHNPLLCSPMFLARYAEKAGTGTLMMIDKCREAGLPEPEFLQDGGEFVQTVWRDWLAPSRLSGLTLNERQRNALSVARLDRRLTNQQYQRVTGCSRATAKRDLEDLVAKGLLLQVGSGRLAHYDVSPRQRASRSDRS